MIGCILAYPPSFKSQRLYVRLSAAEVRKQLISKYGYNRDKKKGKTQIVFGLLCSAKGCPIAVEVFEGNTSDGATLSGQIEKVRKGWGIENVVWVSDRGIFTNSKIKELVKPIEG